MVNVVGFRRILGLQQWFVLLLGVAYLLFYGGLAEVWRERRQTEVQTQIRVARKDSQVRLARERRAGRELRASTQRGGRRRRRRGL